MLGKRKFLSEKLREKYPSTFLKTPFFRNGFNFITSSYNSHTPYPALSKKQFTIQTRKHSSME